MIANERLTDLSRAGLFTKSGHTRNRCTFVCSPPTSPKFWQVHRSTIINVDHLSGTRCDEASRLFVRMKGFARELPVARAYVPLFKAM